jgi:rhodanese-related sulfurtransferase
MSMKIRLIFAGTAALALLLAVILLAPALAAEPFTLDAVRAQVRQDYRSLPHLSTQALERAMAAKDNLLVLDVRERQEFAVSRIKGAQRVDPGIWRWTFMNRFGEKVRGKTVVFYCSVGMRSSRLAATVRASLMEQGAKGVYNLDGGVFAWHNETRALVNGNGVTDFVHPFDRKWGTLVKRQALVRVTP